MNTSKNILKLITSIGLCLGIWLFAILFDAPQVEPIYVSLEKPWLAPSLEYLQYGWAVLFVILGIVLFLLWKDKNKEGAGPVLTLFLVQLVLIIVRNLSFAFSPDLLSGFVIGMLMLVNVCIITILAWKIRRAITWLLIPYIVGLTVTIVLNASILYLNR